MMHDDQYPEFPTDADLLSVDWGSLTDRQLNKFIEENLKYIERSAKLFGAKASYLSNIRSLIMMMTITLVMVIQNAENKMIVMTIMGFQIIKTLFSRLAELNFVESMNDSKKTLSEMLKSIKRKED